jgi:hypothetical protein
MSMSLTTSPSADISAGRGASSVFLEQRILLQPGQRQRRDNLANYVCSALRELQRSLEQVCPDNPIQLAS